MKKIFLLVSCLLLVLSGIVFASIVGTPHNIATGGCVACHTPHGAVSSTNGPLWNRSQATQTYTPYSSATLDMGPIVAGDINAPQTIACLTCHNGVTSTVVNAPGPGTTVGSAWDSTTVAAGAALGFAGTTNTFANIGTDLSNDHPIGFVYDNTKGPAGEFATVAAVTAAKLPLYTVGAAVNRVECATCHDVHNVAYPTPTATEVYFLRMTNVNSAMCRTCHITK